MKRSALFLTITIVLAVLISTAVIGEGYIVGRFKPPADVRQDYTIPDPSVAPTGAIIAGSSSCTVGEAQRLAIYEMNSGGITKISPASGDLTPSSGVIRVLRATRPTLNSATTYWGVAWAKASEGFGTWRTCVTGTAQDASQNSVAAVSTTFNCSCQVGNVVQSTNTTGPKTIARTDTLGIMKFGSYNSAITRLPLTELQNWINFSGTTYPTFSLDAGVTSTFMYPMIGQEVHVCKLGCPYSTIASAITAITDAANNKRYTVVVHAGDWPEIVVLKSYVSIMGTGIDGTRIQSIGSDSTDQTEIGIYNLSTGHISGPGGSTSGKTFYVAGCKIGIIDGSASWGDTARACTTGQAVAFYSSGNLYRGKNSALEIYGDGDFRSRGDHFIVNSAASSGTPAGAPNPTACAVLRDESGARGDIAGAIIEVTSTSTSEPAAGLGCIYAPILAASRTSRMKVVGSTIRVTGTSASRNANLSCLTVPTGTCAETSASADSWELRDVDCVVEAADSSSTLRGIHFPSDADHVNWTQTFQGGSIQLTGGATRYDVDNADTASGSSTTLINVQRAGALNGAGKTYTIGNYPAAACSAKCTVGQECTNTSPALCLCTAADTWTKVSGGGACP